MTFDLRLKAVVFKDASRNRERVIIELIPADPAGNERNNRRQVTYFNTAASFIARLDRAGLQASVYAHIKKALDSVFRTRGMAVRVEGILLDSEQISALGFRGPASSRSG
jgi:hypothetical protein